MNRRSILLVSALMTASTLVPPASAHGPRGSKPTGANGGDIVDVEGGHLELVVTPTELRLYVTDLADAPLPSAGLAGRAIVQDGSKQNVLALTPSAPNLLVSALSGPLGKGARVAISANLAKGGKPVQARFVVK